MEQVFADIDAVVADTTVAEITDQAQPAPMDELTSAETPVDGAPNLDVIMDIPVNISMEVGRIEISIRNLLQLNQGSVIELDRLAGEPLDVLVHGTLIAHGEVVVVNEKFGKGVLRDMLLGKYRNPRIEKKVFMFVDLKSSTMLAEKMGYIKYSSLIQQCFYDLNEVVRKYDGQIYQYVGDEAVIFWDFDKGIEKNRCIECFFAFRNKLNLKSGFYKKKFQLLPEFKAGIHGGDLIVTEVGVAKKEIAYHGDVINTTARIQEQCSSFEKELLVSGSIYNELKFTGVHSCINLGEVLLKGKQKPIEIYTVQEN